MKNNYKVELHLSEELLRKLLIISKEEGRSVNNQFVLMLRNTIQYYERTKGHITPQRMAAEDISGFAQINEKNDLNKNGGEEN